MGVDTAIYFKMPMVINPDAVVSLRPIFYGIQHSTLSVFYSPKQKQLTPSLALHLTSSARIFPLT